MQPFGLKPSTCSGKPSHELKVQRGAQLRKQRVGLFGVDFISARQSFLNVPLLYHSIAAIWGGYAHEAAEPERQRREADFCRPSRIKAPALDGMEGRGQNRRARWARSQLGVGENRHP